MEGEGNGEIWHNDSVGDEDDARTSNTRITQRKRSIPHSTIRAGKQTSATSVTIASLLVFIFVHRLFQWGSLSLGVDFLTINLTFFQTAAHRPLL